MKKISLLPLLLSLLIFCSCNNGENAGAGSDTNPVLKPNVGGISDDTTGRDSVNRAIDTSRAYAPTDTANKNK